MSTQGKERNKISVYVANLGKYNEGFLVGDWIDLPVPQSELDRFLRDKVGLETNPVVAHEKSMRGERVYEEYAIHDFNFNKGLAAINYRPSEYENLDDLNLLAACIANLTPGELEAIALCADQECDMDALQYANLAAQVDEIPFYSYDFTGIEHADCWPNEEKLGYTLLEGSPIMNALEEAGLSDYFDMERYGESQSYNLVLSDEGYLDCAANFPDFDFYERDELEDLVAEQMGDDGYFKDAQDQASGLDSRCALAIDAASVQDMPSLHHDTMAR